MATYQRFSGPSHPRRTTVAIQGMRNIFLNVCILCGTAVVMAITAKVILSLF